jgi:hypothetical protein
MKVSLVFILFIFFSVNCRSASEKSITEKRVSTNKVDSLANDYDTRVNELKQQLSDNFIIKSHSYFVIASNMSEAETQKILETTIDRAVECFYNDYFSVKPEEPTTIFLFKDDKTYRYWAKTLYGDDDLSRFGYYKPSEKTMLMNINTGTGTLVHEMTHALARYDFPDIPSWFNEGLGSLYERCSLNDKNILGYVNWRLPALQDAIKDKSYTSLEKLMRTGWNEFYGDRSDVNYSQARYFCLYMQEKGFLKSFYKHFRDTFKDDSTGIKQAEYVMGKSLAVIEADYLDWVSTLKYE